MDENMSFVIKFGQKSELIYLLKIWLSWLLFKIVLNEKCKSKTNLNNTAINKWLSFKNEHLGLVYSSKNQENFTH